MKGGRTAPRKVNGNLNLLLLEHFNEGGADCPPKDTIPPQHSPAESHFNEGGADCPPKAIPRRYDCS